MIAGGHLYRPLQGSPYLVAHGESSIVGCRPPEVGHVSNIKQINQIQPSIQDEPTRLPMLRHEVGIAPPRKGEGVDEEKSKYHHDAAQDAPPEFPVHERLHALFSLHEILHG